MRIAELLIQAKIFKSTHYCPSQSTTKNICRIGIASMDKFLNSLLENFLEFGENFHLKIRTNKVGIEIIIILNVDFVLDFWLVKEDFHSFVQASWAISHTWLSKQASTFVLYVY